MSMVNEWKHLEIPFDEIKEATKNFKTLIGRGGYGWVFKGKLIVSGKKTKVAVKRLDEQCGQGLKEFLTEIQLLSGQQHPNLISLVGFCDEGREKSIVYEYAERGSLDQYIRRTRKTTSTTLTWLQRLKICADAARGLDYLHNHVGGHRTIIHRDIKSSNILIDENWVGKISDLGLSKLSVTGFGMSVIVSNGCGTQGYCEPEYYITGFVTKKSDVYSFGVVLFEVLCGRLCLIDSDDGFSLSSISAKEYYKNNTLDKIIDQSLREHIGLYSMTKFAAIAYRCLHDDREQRPAMDVVVKELEEALEDANDEYWETKLPEDLDSLIKLFKIPHEVYTNKKELFSYLHKGIYFDGGNSTDDSTNDVVHPVHPSVVIIIGVLCTTFCLSFLILACTKFCHSDVTFQAPHAIIRSRTRFSGIDKKAIESLPFFRFSSLKGSKEGLECVVCLSKFEDSEVLRLLPKCKHAFHMKCIDEWLESHSTCPLCRYKFDESDIMNFSCTNSLRYPQNEDFTSLEIFIKREHDGSSRSSRFSIGSITKFGKSPKEEALIQYGDQRLLDKFKHRIIVSDIVCKSRWSDVNSSDLMFLNSKMLNEVSSKRFSPSSSGRSFEIDVEKLMKFKEDMERRRLHELKVGKTLDNGESSVSFPNFPTSVTNEESEGIEKRSMSEITNVSRFRERRSSYWLNSGKEEALQRVWLPMAKRTIQWFTNREKNSFASRT